AHADEDVLDGCRFLLRGELVCDGPARRPRHRSQPAALILRIHFDHAAVDLVGQLVAHREHAPVLFLHLRQALAERVLWVGAQPAGGRPPSCRGTILMVRRFAVTSSPVRPSPRVAPCTSRPFSYLSVTASPSSFGSTTYRRGSSPNDRCTRASNSRNSSSVIA